MISSWLDCSPRWPVLIVARRDPTRPKFRLHIEIDPATTGGNPVLLYAFTQQGQPQKVEEWKVTAALPSAGIELVDVPVLKINDNHPAGSVALPAAGQWRFQFTLRIRRLTRTPSLHKCRSNKERK
jgi:hypothetical protein